MFLVGVVCSIIITLSHLNIKIEVVVTTRWERWAGAVGRRIDEVWNQAVVPLVCAQSEINLLPLGWEGNLRLVLPAEIGEREIIIKHNL